MLELSGCLSKHSLGQSLFVKYCLELPLDCDLESLIGVSE